MNQVPDPARRFGIKRFRISKQLPQSDERQDQWHKKQSKCTIGASKRQHQARYRQTPSAQDRPLEPIRDPLRLGPLNTRKLIDEKDAMRNKSGDKHRDYQCLAARYLQNPTRCFHPENDQVAQEKARDSYP